MAVLATCKFDEDPIKIEGTTDRTRSNMGFFSTQGQVTLDVNRLMWLEVKFIRDGCSGYLQDWRRLDQKLSRYHLDNIVSIISLWENFSLLKGK